MPSLPESVPPRGYHVTAHEKSAFTRKKRRVSSVRRQILRALRSEAAHGETQWREEIRVHGLREKVLEKEQFEHAHDDSLEEFRV